MENRSPRRVIAAVVAIIAVNSDKENFSASHAERKTIADRGRVSVRIPSCRHNLHQDIARSGRSPKLKSDFAVRPNRIRSNGGPADRNNRAPAYRAKSVAPYCDEDAIVVLS